MSKTPSKSSPSDDDPWESLAEGLFGIEYGKEHASRDDAEEALAPADEPEPATEEVADELVHLGRFWIQRGSFFRGGDAICGRLLDQRFIFVGLGGLT